MTVSLRKCLRSNAHVSFAGAYKIYITLMHGGDVTPSSESRNDAENA